MRLRTIVAGLCLAALVSAKTPRPVADVPIPVPGRKPVELKKYHGKILFVVLFATTCGECAAVVAMAGDLQRELGSKGFQVVGAAVEDDAEHDVLPFIQRYRPNFPVGYLAKDPLIKLADIPQGVRPYVPIVMFIDHTGTVRFEYYGNDPMMKDLKKTARVIIEGLIHQRDNHEEPVRVTAPKK